jgi:alpha-beta hydrolase superfamily lysophospholipase
LLLLGHSMGGVVAAHFVAGGIGARQPWSREVDALVLSSPALDPGMSAGQKLLLALLGRLAPDLALHNGLKPEWISRDPLVVQRYMGDPLVHDRIAPRLARFIVDGGARVRERASAWRVPTLLIWAGSDRCVAPAGSAAFAAAAPSAVLSAHEFTPLFHEIFNEPEQQDVFALLGDWLARLEFAPR